MNARETKKSYPLSLIFISFLDTFQLSYQSSPGNSIPVLWTHEGVVWDVDKKQKFRNPGMSNAEDCKTQTLANLTAQFQACL